jgi:hypothetical protein
MKFSAAALVVLSLASSALGEQDNSNDRHSNLRSSFTASECNDIKEQRQCLAAKDSSTDMPCVWCDCSAVPSVCVTQDQAKDLPPGVFDCKTPGSNHNDDAAKTLEGLFDFHLDDRRTFQLKESVIEAGSDASDICDSSSKSISGYMDIKGSKYDESGDKVRRMCYKKTEARRT